MYLLKPREDSTLFLWGNQRVPDEELGEEMDLSPDWATEERWMTEQTPASNHPDWRRDYEIKQKNVEEVMENTKHECTCPHKEHLAHLWDRQNRIIQELKSLRREQKRSPFRELEESLEAIPNKKQREELLNKFYQVEFSGLLDDGDTLSVETNPFYPMPATPR